MAGVTISHLISTVNNHVTADVTNIHVSGIVTNKAIVRLFQVIV